MGRKAEVKLVALALGLAGTGLGLVSRGVRASHLEALRQAGEGGVLSIPALVLMGIIGFVVLSSLIALAFRYIQRLGD